MEIFKDIFEFLKSLNLKCLIVLFSISTSFQLFAPPPVQPSTVSSGFVTLDPKSLLFINEEDVDPVDPNKIQEPKAILPPPRAPIFPNLSGKNHYEVLEVPRTATSRDIQKAYVRKSLIWHPDRWNNEHPNATKNDKGRAEEIFKIIENANDVLSDPKKRSSYDFANPYADYDPANEPIPVVKYEESFTGASKEEIDEKLYAVFKEVCRKEGFEWHETDDLWMAFNILCYGEEPVECRLLFLKHRALGLFDNPADSILVNFPEAKEYIEYIGSDRNELSRLRNRAFNVYKMTYQESLKSKIGFFGFITPTLFSSKLEEARSATVGGTYAMRLEKLKNLMLKHPELSSDAIFNALSEASQKEALDGFLGHLQERRSRFACPEKALPQEIRRMPEGAGKTKAIRKFVSEIKKEEFEILKINVGKTINYKIGALLSLLFGGSSFIYAGYKYISDVREMKKLNARKLKRHQGKNKINNQKINHRELLKRIALPVGLGFGCIILRYFILYLKSQVKLSGGFDTTADYVYVAPPPEPSPFGGSAFFDLNDLFKAFFGGGAGFFNP